MGEENTSQPRVDVVTGAFGYMSGRIARLLLASGARSRLLLEDHGAWLGLTYASELGRRYR